MKTSLSFFATHNTTNTIVPSLTLQHPTRIFFNTTLPLAVLACRLTYSQVAEPFPQNSVSASFATMPGLVSTTRYTMTAPRCRSQVVSRSSIPRQNGSSDVFVRVRRSLVNDAFHAISTQKCCGKFCSVNSVAGITAYDRYTKSPQSIFERVFCAFSAASFQNKLRIAKSHRLVKQWTVDCHNPMNTAYTNPLSRLNHLTINEKRLPCGY